MKEDVEIKSIRMMNDCVVKFSNSEFSAILSSMNFKDPDEFIALRRFMEFYISECITISLRFYAKLHHSGTRQRICRLKKVASEAHKEVSKILDGRKNSDYCYGANSSIEFITNSYIAPMDIIGKNADMTDEGESSDVYLSRLIDDASIKHAPLGLNLSRMQSDLKLLVDVINDLQESMPKPKRGPTSMLHVNFLTVRLWVAFRRLGGGGMYTPEFYSFVRNTFAIVNEKLKHKESNSPTEAPSFLFNIDALKWLGYCGDDAIKKRLMGLFNAISKEDIEKLDNIDDFEIVNAEFLKLYSPVEYYI